MLSIGAGSRSGLSSVWIASVISSGGVVHVSTLLITRMSASRTVTCAPCTMPGTDSVRIHQCQMASSVAKNRAFITKMSRKNQPMRATDASAVRSGRPQMATTAAVTASSSA